MTQLVGTVLIVLFSIGCTTAPVGPSASAVSAPSPVGRPSVVFRVAAAQARQMATLVGFLDAFNAGKVDSALALVTDDVFVGDCDYAQGTTVNYRGRVEVANWLRARAEDGDQIVVAGFYNENPEGNAIGLIDVKRRSGSLARRGFTNGIEYEGSPKVAFASDGRMLGFVYGSPPRCKLN